jgi:hypothetical protein
MNYTKTDSCREANRQKDEQNDDRLERDRQYIKNMTKTNLETELKPRHE